MNIQAAVKYSIDRSAFASRTETEEQWRREQQAKDAAYSYAEEGWAHACQGREAEAQRCYQRAAAIDGNTFRRIAGAQWVEAGEYAQGWALISSRGDTHWTGPLAPPRWDGQPVKGTLAVMPSGGLGDQILFARFVPYLKRRAGRVVIAAPKSLLRLFRRLEGADDVVKIDRVPNGQVSFAFAGKQPDAWVDMDALPHLLGVRLESIPTEPYLSADLLDVERWRSKLQQGGLRVGLVWKTCKTARQAYRRSLPSLAALAPLWQVPGVSFVSLQKGDGEDEARASALPLTLVDDRDLADAAAIISQLDLVIGTDVCVTNLSGAMGVPTWVLAEPHPNFRLRHGWYKSGRLFTQRSAGDWSHPIGEAAAALAAFAGRG